MPPRFTAPIGTDDVLPPEADRRRALTDRFAERVERDGFAMVGTPMFEDLGVFQRLGEGTDVVAKEMYDFVDKGDRRMALRPESTAGVARAFIQHRPALPWKVWYSNAHFRYEAPQKGRSRQHHQLGAEVFGIADPDLDADIITMLWDFYAELGLRRLRLELNFIGDAAVRRDYARLLGDYLQTHRHELDESDVQRIESNPLRVLDSKKPASRAVVEGAPRLADHLDEVSSAHGERVMRRLDANGVPYTVQPALVRGLDYYTHTVFEVISDAIDAAQSTIGGGGRYDGLVAALDGPDTPGVGFGAGVERTLLALDAEGLTGELDRVAPLVAFGVHFGDHADAVGDVVTELRRAGLGADRLYDRRSPKAQMKAANRSTARVAVMIGDDEAAAGTVTVRDLRRDGDSTPQFTVPRGDIVSVLRSMT